MVRLALYQPDIPQNTGAIMRLAACMSVGLDVIGPTGFVWDEKRMRRTGLDYRTIARVARYPSWEAFLAARHSGRLLLLTTLGSLPYQSVNYRPDDILLLGQESAGAPRQVHETVDLRLRIPMTAEARSLNVALAAAMVVGEALRQTGTLPADPP